MKTSIVIGVAAVLSLGFLIWQLNSLSHPQKSPLTTTLAATASSPATIEQAPMALLPQPGLAGPSLPETLAEVQGLLGKWSQRKTSDTATEENLLRQLLALLTDANAAQITQSLNSDQLASPLGMAALTRWMKTNPVVGANWMAAQPGTTENESAVVAQNLIADGVDPLTYTSQLQASPWKQNLLLLTGLDSLTSNPGEVLGLAQEMDPGTQRTNLYQTAASEWMTDSPDSTRQWIMSVSDRTLRDQLISAAAKAYANNQPLASATWAISSMVPGGALDNTIYSIASVWSSSAPRQAAAWVSQLPDGDLRDAATVGVLNQWRQSDAAAAKAWLQGFPAGRRPLVGTINAN